MDLTLDVDVVGVHAAAGEKALVFLPADRLSDAEFFRKRFHPSQRCPSGASGDSQGRPRRDAAKRWFVWPGEEGWAAALKMTPR